MSQGMHYVHMYVRKYCGFYVRCMYVILSGQYL